MVTLIDKGDYAVITKNDESYSIAKNAVLLTTSPDSILIRLMGSRKVLVNILDSEYEGDLLNALTNLLYTK